ncbi:aminofutalosine synthase MqnE [Symbiobacterium thermophilum]|uniref:Aminodeoxyfutalosine synthase n=1 Tax=Symbiobacterium thermophilum TaxID=2734 RepID=A0A953LJT6_SYMTR|nr:aminofutalosine synthase MqnE [Symbiobacterium thermophilum]
MGVSTLLERTLDARLAPIYRKVVAGERLSFDDGVTLMTHPNLFAVGQLANLARRLRVGDQVYFNNNAHINYSNVCAIHCKFCAFGQSRRSPRAFTLSIDEIVAKARAAVAQGATELHMVGGLHPDLPWEWYPAMLRAVKAACPDVHLKCFTAIELIHFTRISGLSLEEVLLTLKEAGLGSLPGGGAEIFAPRVREAICKPKETAEEWLHVHDTAHRLGLKSNATMLYGTIETPEERVDHLIRLREQQDRSGGFQAFIPLRFHPENTGLAHLPGPTGYDDLRVIAVGRLMLDNFPHIKSYWIASSPAITQVALHFGANDIDGTVREEKIYHMAGARTAQYTELQQLLRMIWEAGRIPAERNTVYEVIRAYPPEPDPQLVADGAIHGYTAENVHLSAAERAIAEGRFHPGGRRGRPVPVQFLEDPGQWAGGEGNGAAVDGSRHAGESAAEGRV